MTMSIIPVGISDRAQAKGAAAAPSGDSRTITCAVRATSPVTMPPSEERTANSICAPKETASSRPRCMTASRWRPSAANCEATPARAKVSGASAAPARATIRWSRRRPRGATGMPPVGVGTAGEVGAGLTGSPYDGCGACVEPGGSACGSCSRALGVLGWVAVDGPGEASPCARSVCSGVMSAVGLEL